MHPFGMTLKKIVAEPPAELKRQHLREPVFGGFGSTLPPFLWRTAAIPCGRINEGNAAGAIFVSGGKSLGDTAAHGTSGYCGGWPPDMVEYRGEIVSEEPNSICAAPALRLSVSAAIVGQNFKIALKLINGLIPDSHSER